MSNLWGPPQPGPAASSQNERCGGLQGGNVIDMYVIRARKKKVKSDAEET